MILLLYHESFCRSFSPFVLAYHDQLCQEVHAQEYSLLELTENECWFLLNEQLLENGNWKARVLEVEPTAAGKSIMSSWIGSRTPARPLSLEARKFVVIFPSEVEDRHLQSSSQVFLMKHVN